MSTVLPPTVKADEPPVYDGSSQGDRSSIDKKDGIVSGIPPLAAVNDTPTGLFAHWRNRRKRNYDLDAIATQASVFDDPNTLEHYRPPPQYENTHRFDPLARWTWREEKVRSFDIKYSHIEHSTEPGP